MAESTGHPLHAEVASRALQHHTERRGVSPPFLPRDAQLQCCLVFTSHVCVMKYGCVSNVRSRTFSNGSVLRNLWYLHLLDLTPSIQGTPDPLRGAREISNTPRHLCHGHVPWSTSHLSPEVTAPGWPAALQVTHAAICGAAYGRNQLKSGSIPEYSVVLF